MIHLPKRIEIIKNRINNYKGSNMKKIITLGKNETFKAVNEDKLTKIINFQNKIIDNMKKKNDLPH